MALNILVADGDRALAAEIVEALVGAGHSVTSAHTRSDVHRHLDDGGLDVIVADVALPGCDGAALLELVQDSAPDVDLILTTGRASVPDAVAALKAGAIDYLVKPLEMDRLRHELTRLAEHRRLRREVQRMRRALRRPAAGFMVGTSEVMRRLFERVATIAASDASVLITGESGTGKELVARALHDKSARANRPLVAVNCAAFPDTLLEAELFGHERGAFTGATKRRAGRFKAADGGTLFLDEVAELPPQAQAKLLRVLQEGVFQPLGSNEDVRVNVRIVSATHQRLKRLVAERRFREDLYYRLKVLTVTIPPLRDRRGDIPALVEHFLQRYAPDGRVTGLTPEAWTVVGQYGWPGNVRELEHAVHHAVVLAGAGLIDVAHLPEDVVEDVIVASAAPAGRAGAVPLMGAPIPLAQAMREYERAYLLRALEAHDGSRQKTAAALGISRKNLWEKLRGHQIQWPVDGKDG